MINRNILDIESVIKGSDNQDYKNKVVVLKARRLGEKFKEDKFQLWFATSGFGCSPTAIGRAVFANCLEDGEHARWERYDFLGIYNGELTDEQKDVIRETVYGIIDKLEFHLSKDMDSEESKEVKANYKYLCDLMGLTPNIDVR